MLKNQIKDVEIAELVASRLNHDFVAPLTAISNGMELMKIAPTSSEECLEMIAQSVDEAIVRVKLYRLAFGACSEVETVNSDDMIEQMSQFAKFEQSGFNSAGLPEQIKRLEAKMLSLSMLCLRSSFARMNGIALQFNNQFWSLEANGSGRIDLDGQLRAEQEWHGTDKPTANTIHFKLFHSTLERMDKAFTLNSEYDDHMHLIIKDK